MIYNTQLPQDIITLIGQLADIKIDTKHYKNAIRLQKVKYKCMWCDKMVLRKNIEFTKINVGYGMPWCQFNKTERREMKRTFCRNYKRFKHLAI